MSTLKTLGKEITKLFKRKNIDNKQYLVRDIIEETNKYVEDNINSNTSSEYKIDIYNYVINKLIDVKTKLEIDPDKNYEDISLLLEEIVKYDDIRYKLKTRSSGQVIRRLKENLELYEIPYDDYIVVNHSTFSTNKYYKNGDESIECKRWKLSFESELRKALRAKNIREIEDLQVDSDEIMFIDFIFKVREMPKHSKDRFKKDYCQIDVDNLVKAPLDVITKVFNIRDENGRYNDNNFRPHADKFPGYAENGTYPNYGENEQIWFAIRNVTKKELNRLQEFDNKKNN